MLALVDVYKRQRLEYEGYCNKIRKGLEDLDEKSGERALWELVQNARDTSSEADVYKRQHIKIPFITIFRLAELYRHSCID